ncbi:secreted RxLR effector protein 161-like [Gastrolobium bilobum]|uniref:secreted RxLR effector protein 161-like n=1 Tax=Gastrolobium bilobum TaxID=150636 RepID=UPI002AAF2506|nr:secreted RxLR effector protein 161-like [Gastrolobium bilobum]
MASVPYASADGILMYATICTLPDITHAVRVLNRHMSKLGNEHWTVVKRVFCYLHGTYDLRLCYEGVKSSRGQTLLELRCFVDADWGGDIDSRRSTSGYVVFLFGGAISWISKRHTTVALSTTEEEYMALTHVLK